MSGKGVDDFGAVRKCFVIQVFAGQSFGHAITLPGYIRPTDWAEPTDSRFSTANAS